MHGDKILKEKVAPKENTGIERQCRKEENFYWEDK